MTGWAWARCSVRSMLSWADAGSWGAAWLVAGTRARTCSSAMASTAATIRDPPGTPEATRPRSPSQSSNTTPAAHCPHPPVAPGNIASCRPRIRVICSATKSSRRGGVRPSMNSCTTQASPVGAWPVASHFGAGQPRTRAASTSSRAPSSRSGSLARHFSTALEPPPPVSRYAPSFQPPARRRSNRQRPPSWPLTAPSTSPMPTRTL